ncbi:hypothetical protein [Nocardioides sp.]|uniref:hypothetical protein n=1 Tax=Nocardioides sp. TaxID=35761 RepID=UPI002733FE67|nr:hypothetical protein [Nocardioides sp.]MDP3892937.1 hypothetical protein [Nocardioides sp.]
MQRFGRIAFLLDIPITLILILWIWLGRVVFGVYGWFLVFIPLFVGPFLLAAALISIVLAYAVPIRPRAFPRTMLIARVVMWAGMFGTGLFLPDFGDTSDSQRSVLTQVFGQSDVALSASYALATAWAIVAVVGWVAVIVTSILAIRGARRS